MPFIILGIIILVIAFALQRNNQFHRFANVAKTLAIMLVLIGVITASVVQIDAGQVGVKSLFGNVQNDVLGGGLHFINPLVEVRRLDIKTQNYTMSGVHDEGMKQGDDAIRVLTSDGLEVTIDLTVLYKLLPSEAPKLVRETGVDYTDKIVRPLTRTKIRDNAVYYEAIALYSTKRDEFQQRIFKSIEDDFKKEDWYLNNYWSEILHFLNQ